jgi:hypothetical protein
MTTFIGGCGEIIVTLSIYRPYILETQINSRRKAGE